MRLVSEKDIRQLNIPSKKSHKGQNGRLLIIGGSHLFHAASLWSLTVASRIVDLVHYSSVPENNELVLRLKQEFRSGIVVPRTEIELYIEEDDCILIGPGMVRTQRELTTHNLQPTTIAEIEQIEDEGLQTYSLTNFLLRKYPEKQWVIDAGALQMMDVTLIPKNAILTPHKREFEYLLLRIMNDELRNSLKDLEMKEQIEIFAKEFNCIVLVKGVEDIVCSKDECRKILGGNEGMTKGGTGDVLAGLIAALVCKNDPFLATIAGSFINKSAGDTLYKRVGPYFNASDLADEIPRVMRQLLVKNKSLL